MSELDYKPATREESLAAARGILGRLNVPPPLAEVASGGRCDDCSTACDSRLRLGAFDLCHRCWLSRAKTKTRTAA